MISLASWLVWKTRSQLTVSCIILKNGQIYFKNIVVWKPKEFWNVWPFSNMYERVICGKWTRLNASKKLSKWLTAEQIKSLNFKTNTQIIRTNIQIATIWNGSCTAWYEPETVTWKGKNNSANLIGNMQCQRNYVILSWLSFLEEPAILTTCCSYFINYSTSTWQDDRQIYVYTYYI